MRALCLMRCLAAAILLLCCLTSAESSPGLRSSFVYGDLFSYDESTLTQLIDNLRAGGFNTAAFPVAWSIVEPENGRFDFNGYTNALDRLSAAGLVLIIVLDSSGRELIDIQRGSLLRRAIPDWLKELAPDSEAIDFMDIRGLNLDYNDTLHLAHLQDFYDQAVVFFMARYGSKIHAFVPGITHELEIKYSQYGYRWQSYTEAAQTAFGNWLQSQGKPAAKLPIIDYPNSIASGRPRQQALFPDLMRFREARAAEYACQLAAWIRQAGGRSGAYFGQSFSSHDAIYAVGVIEHVVDCFDSITVDFNYFNGYGIDPNPWVPALLVDYAHQLGYSEVAAGLYLERYYESGAADALERAWPVLQQTLRNIGREGVQNVEIGNLALADLSRLDQAFWAALEADPAQDWQARYKLGLVASKWTFYLWTGEHSYERNLLEDTLLASFRLLSEQADFDVAVLGERALLSQDLSRFDALILPHQTAVSEPAAQAIRRYYEQGGMLVQDVQYRSFEPDGTLREGWENDLFGIGGISWHQQPEKFLVAGRRLVLPPQSRMYFNYALLAPQPGYTLLMRRFNNPDQGLMLKGPRSLVFGFLPQLIDDPGKGDFWQRLYIDAIRSLLTSKTAFSDAAKPEL